MPNTPFDLDALEREATPEPFTFAVGGQEFTATNVQEHDWQDLAAVGDDLEKILRLALGKEQYAEFKKIRSVPTWKILKLAQAIQEHYGVGSLGEGAGLSGS